MRLTLKRGFIAAGLGLAVAIVASLYLLLRGEGTTNADYYFEARITIEVDPELDPEPYPVDVARTWYKGPLQWRQEWRQEARPGSRAASEEFSFQVSDGATITDYYSERDAYYSYAVPDYLREEGLLLGVNYLGPLTGASLEEYFAPLRLSGVNWRVVGSDRVLGRDVTLVELETPFGAPPGEAEGRTTWWVDTEKMFVLRYEEKYFDFDGVSRSKDVGEVTELHYNWTVPKKTFRFKPPPGSHRAAEPLNK